MHQESNEATSPPPRDDARPSRARRIAAWAVSVVGVVLVVVLVAGFFIHLPYVVISPGNATPLNDSISIQGATTYPHRDGVRYLTVRVERIRSERVAAGGGLARS